MAVTIAITSIIGGLAADRPAASSPGRAYFATDTGQISYDNGTAWTNVGGGTPNAADIWIQMASTGA